MVEDKGVGIFVREIPTQVLSFFNLNQFPDDPEDIESESYEVDQPQVEESKTFMYVIKNTITKVEMGLTKNLSDALVIQEREIRSLEIVKSMIKDKKPTPSLQVIDFTDTKH